MTIDYDLSIEKDDNMVTLETHFQPLNMSTLTTVQTAKSIGYPLNVSLS